MTFQDYLNELNNSESKDIALTSYNRGMVDLIKYFSLNLRDASHTIKTADAVNMLGEISYKLTKIGKLTNELEKVE